MKIVILTIVSLIMMNIQLLHSQDYSIREYATEDANLVASSLQKTSNGDFIITTYNYCYTPGGTFFEGCFIARPLFNINVFGDTIWTSNINSWHNTLNGQMFENSDGSFSFLTTKPTNYICENLVGGGIFGFGRTIGYKTRLNSGEVLDEVVFNEECDLTLVDYTLTKDSTILFLGEYDNFAIGENYTELVRTDQKFNTLQTTILPSDGKKYYAVINSPQNENFLLQTDYNSNTINLVSIDVDGNILDSVRISDYTALTNIRSITVTQDSELLIALGVIDYGNNQRKHFELLRVTLDGTIKWKNKYPGRDNGAIIETTGQQILYATSSFNPMTNSDDVLIRILNANGDSIGYKIYDVYGNDDTPRTIFENEQNELLILGNSNCCNKDTSTGPAKVFFIRDTSDIIVSTNTIESQSSSIDFYPNPFGKELRIFAPNSLSNAQLSIVDALGRTVYDVLFPFQYAINTEQWTSGIYFYQLRQKGQIIQQGKLIKQ